MVSTLRVARSITVTEPLLLLLLTYARALSGVNASRTGFEPVAITAATVAVGASMMLTKFWSGCVTTTVRPSGDTNARPRRLEWASVIVVATVFVARSTTLIVSAFDCVGVLTT